jgi:20S proteasome alpha/beta subunit
MTVVVGLKYKEGIIISSDSQATLNRGVPLKKLNHMKLFEIKNNSLDIIIGGAGSVPFISKAIEEIKKRIKEENTSSFSDVINFAESAILHVTRWFNFERMQDLQPRIILPEPKQRQANNKKILQNILNQPLMQQVQMQLLDIILLIAGKDGEGEFQIYVVYNEGIGEKQQVTASIGSGAAYAEYILSQLAIKELSEKEAVKIVIHSINEVTKIDPGVGGVPVVYIINIKGISQLKPEKVYDTLEELEHIKNHISDTWQKYLSGKFDKDFKKMRENRSQ